MFFKILSPVIYKFTGRALWVQCFDLTSSTKVPSSSSSLFPFYLLHLPRFPFTQSIRRLCSLLALLLSLLYLSTSHIWEWYRMISWFSCNFPPFCSLKEITKCDAINWIIFSDSFSYFGGCLLVYLYLFKLNFVSHVSWWFRIWDKSEKSLNRWDNLANF